MERARKTTRTKAKPARQRVMRDEGPIVLGDKGRMVIPADIRRVLGWKKGDHVTVALEDGRMIVALTRDQLRRLREHFNAMVPGGGTIE